MCPSPCLVHRWQCLQMPPLLLGWQSPRAPVTMPPLPHIPRGSLRLGPRLNTQPPNKLLPLILANGQIIHTHTDCQHASNTVHPDAHCGQDGSSHSPRDPCHKRQARYSCCRRCPAAKRSHSQSLPRPPARQRGLSRGLLPHHRPRQVGAAPHHTRAAAFAPQTIPDSHRLLPVIPPEAQAVQSLSLPSHPHLRSWPPGISDFTPCPFCFCS